MKQRYHFESHRNPVANVTIIAGPAADAPRLPRLPSSPRAGGNLVRRANQRRIPVRFTGLPVI